MIINAINKLINYSLNLIKVWLRWSLSSKSSQCLDSHVRMFRLVSLTEQSLTSQADQISHSLQKWSVRSWCCHWWRFDVILSRYRISDQFFDVVMCIDWWLLWRIATTRAFVHFIHFHKVLRWKCVSLTNVVDIIRTITLNVVRQKMTWKSGNRILKWFYVQIGN